MITKAIEDFGGSLDSDDNSSAFRAATQFFAENKGGTLTVGEGVWRTGPIELCSDMTLRLADGAVVSFIPDPSLYKPVQTRWEGVCCWAMHPCVFVNDAHDVTIEGNGIFDGNGDFWWNTVIKKRSQVGPVDAIEKELALLNPDYKTQASGGGGRLTQFLRPPLMQFYECKNIRVSDITLQNSPFWTFHPVFCDNMLVEHVKVSNPYTAPNTDGMDIDSCTNVSIKGCRIAVGDDGICIKSGSGPDGIKVNRPSDTITVFDCIVDNGHGGIVIGSETAGGIHKVRVSHCTFNGTDRGIRIKTRRGRGGAISGLYFENLDIHNSLCPIAINMYYRCGSKGTEPELFSLDPMPVSDDTPSISTVHISKIMADDCRASTGFIVGLPEAPIEDLIIENCVFGADMKDVSSPSVSEMYAGLPEVHTKSFRVVNAKNPVFENTQIIGPEEPFIFK
ncbi:MAG: glycoside hydrolase family 28 protein [Treponema sp.]|nr:glycoside hydrolase family 28 protein [Treponema sp.]